MFVRHFIKSLAKWV